MIDFFIEIDENLFLYLNGLGATSWDGFWLYLSRTLSAITIPLFLFLLVASYRVLGFKKVMLAIGVVIVLLLATEFLSIFVKNEIGRLRPCYNDALISKMRLIKSYCGGQFGYFSAHAGNSFGLATFFGFLLQKRTLFWLLIFWALLVSYSRIYIGVHFPFDVLTGAFVGAFLAWLFYKVLFKRLLKKYYFILD